MKRVPVILSAIAVAAIAAAAPSAQTPAASTPASKAPPPNRNVKTLDIYVADTEGGKAALFVSPSGQTVLIDSGNPGARDGDRIVAGLEREHGPRQPLREPGVLAQRATG